jgi:hypothetical protein
LAPLLLSKHMGAYGCWGLAIQIMRHGVVGVGMGVYKLLLPAYPIQ